MERAGIVARSHDAGISETHVVALGFIHQLGFQFVLVTSRFRRAHGAAVGTGHDGGSLAHQRDLAAALEQAHLVQVPVEQAAFLWRIVACPAAETHLIDPAGNSPVEISVLSQCVA